MDSNDAAQSLSAGDPEVPAPPADGAMSGDPLARGNRDRTLIRAEMHGEIMPRQPVLVHDVSETGIGASARGIVPRCGERVTLDLPGGDTIEGIVRWVDDRYFGVALDNAMDVLRLRTMIQRRNEKFGQSLDWLVDQRFRVEPSQGDTRLRRL